MDNEDNQILTPEEAAQFLKISTRKLAYMADQDNPPPKLMVGQQPRYIKSDLIEWLRTNSSN